MTFDQQIAMINQQTAEHRHKWVMQDREDYYYYLTYKGDPMIDYIGSKVLEFNRWSQERAEYARAAMTEMGITEEDQFYA